MNGLEGEVIHAPTRLTQLPSTRLAVRNRIKECRDCSLHASGPLPPKTDLKSGARFVVLGPNPLPDSTILRWINQGLDMDIKPNMALIGANQCVGYGRRGNIEAATGAQLGKCAPLAESAVAAASPEWVFLVGQAAISIWQGGTGGSGGVVSGDHGEILFKRNGKRGVRKVTAREIDARRDRRREVRIEDCWGRVGIWPDVGAWVVCLQEPGRKVNAVKMISSVRRVRGCVNGDVNPLTMLETVCTFCEGWVSWYDEKGMGFCRDCRVKREI